MQISREKQLLPHPASLGQQSQELKGEPGLWPIRVQPHPPGGEGQISHGTWQQNCMGLMLLVNARHRGEAGRQREKQNPMTPSPTPTATVTPVASEGLKK